MIHIDIITILPKLLESPFAHSIMKRAQDKNLLSVNLIDLRPFGVGPNLQSDDYQYGGGAGMVMMCEPLASCIDSLKNQREYDDIIYLSPDGDLLDQGICNELSLKSNLMLICGHYKGIDQRIRDYYITKEISIGEYVISGGELAAAVLVDAIGRLIPGVLNNETSALTDSFQDGLLAPPVYTRPADFKGMKVPDILLSGNDAKIDEWRLEKSLEKTNNRKKK